MIVTISAEKLIIRFNASYVVIGNISFPFSERKSNEDMPTAYEHAILLLPLLYHIICRIRQLLERMFLDILKTATVRELGCRGFIDCPQSVSVHLTHVRVIAFN